MSTPLAPLTGPAWLVFDLDNTLAPTEQYSNPPFVRYMQQTLLAEGHSVPTEEKDFLRYLMESYERSGCAVTHVASLHGLGAPWVDSIYANSAPTSSAAVTEKLTPDAALALLLSQLKQHGHHLHVLTLSHDDYAKPILKHLGLLDTIFDNAHIHTRAFKRQPTPYQSLLSSFPHLQELPRYMVEDSPDNLTPAKQLGFITIGIGPRCHGHPAADYTFATVTEFLTTLLPSAR